MEFDLSFWKEGSSETLNVRTKVGPIDSLINCLRNNERTNVNGLLCSNEQLTEYLNIRDLDDEDIFVSVFMLLPDQTINKFVPGLYCSSRKSRLECDCSWSSVEGVKWQKQ